MAAPPTTTIPTILTLKQNFLTTQTRLLSQAPKPSRAWRRGNNIASQEGGEEQGQGSQNNLVPEKALNDALYRLNHTIQQHARRFYPAQATRHVAEQIESLYLGSIGEHQHHQQQQRRSGGRSGQDGDDEEEVGEDDDDDDYDAWRLVGADYANPAIIAALPPTWDAPREADDHPLDAKRYADLTTSLRDLATRKAEADARVLRLRRMKALLAPFDTNTNVQENLVTRDGEVEKELERMRLLLVRVADKVARLREREGTTGTEERVDELFGEGEAMIVDDVEVVERRKVQVLLDDMR